MDVIRTLKYEELDESMLLSSFAFQYEISQQYMDDARPQLKPEHIWGYYVEGKLAAKLTIIPMQAYIQGHSFAMGGIAGVATWPEHRRKGMVGKLLHKSLEVMKENGETVSFLFPFSFAFYRKYGWGTYVDVKKVTIELSQLPKLEVSDGYMVRADNDWVLLNEMYDAYARKYNGTLQRDEQWWLNSVFKKKKGQAAVYYDASSTPRGYILYQVLNREMNIREMVFLDEKARQGLWNFISNHDSMISKVMLSAPADDQLSYIFGDPKIKQEIETYFMARIVDVPAFLRLYPFISVNLKQSFVWRIDDRYAPWNNATFLVEVLQGRACLKMLFEDEEECKRVLVEAEGKVLSCTIQTLSSMMLGYQVAEFLYEIGEIEGDLESVRCWQALIPKQSTYLMDHF